MFQKILATLRQAARLGYNDPQLTLCVFTDTSDMYRVASIIKFPPNVIEKEMNNQANTSIAFLSGEFSKC